MKKARYTEETARRVLKATTKIERGSRDMPATSLPRAPGDDGGYVGKFAGVWLKGETKTITLWRKISGTWEETSLTFEVENLAADVETPGEESPGWVGFSFRSGAYLVDWFECDVDALGS